MPKKGNLTSAEYTAIRELLGFTRKEAAEFHKVQSLRTIAKWERGDSWVSQLACEKICDLFDKVNARIAESVSVISKYPPNETQAVFIVYPGDFHKKYHQGSDDIPASVHRTMVARTYSILKQKGYDVGIVEFNAQDYMSFLGRNGLKDSPSTRSRWACEFHDRILAQENTEKETTN